MHTVHSEATTFDSFLKDFI